ncbi:MAG: FISUMP domain-containing protein [Tenuifilaceae bacterium]|jgi:uncharacterized protein (TIGR02145 family)|nr:FISUMP domain-containing protein [Tenuifilaceae bacterium]
MTTTKKFWFYAFALAGASAFLFSSCVKEDEKIAPVLSTTEISEITQTSAISGGNISDDGGANVTARGVCWSTSQNPTIDGSKTEDGTGVGSFISNITTLETNTTYYVRAYATNSAGTGYGSTISFTTLESIGLPTLTTADVTEITQTTAASGGNITDDGGVTVTGRGVCWSISQNPTISDSRTEDGTGVGNFISSITGLEPNTTYYVRAYATNSIGTVYGNSIEFSTLEEVTTVTDIDGNVYTTIIIGTQEWMAQNLMTTKYNDGTPITHVTDNNEWTQLASEAYCWYENDEETYGNLYGALYNWYAVNTEGICPIGWHVPTDEEWLTLVDFAGGVDNAAAKLKATSEWNEGGNGTDEYGFSALPGGWRIHATGSFSDLGINGNWWTATEYDMGNAKNRFMYYGDDKVNSTSWRKKAGFSVRCVRDN